MMKKLILILLFPAIVFSADTGFKAPTANDAAGWTNPNNAHTSDDTYASAEAGDTERYKTFAFGLTSETIDGFEFQGECQTGDFPASALTFNIHLSWDGGTTWTTESNQITCSAPFGGPDGTYTVGCSTCLFGRSWAASELSDANFKVRIVEPTVCPCFPGDNLFDAVAVKVHYTLASSGNNAGRRRVSVSQ